MRQTVSILAGCIILLLIQACAFDVVRVKQIPMQLEAVSAVKSMFELEKEVEVNLDTGYSRILKKGTRWIYVGSTSHGNVYKTKDQILTIEGSNIHEAYIVVKSQNLVGFYLPVERAFSPLNKQVELNTKEIRL